jgi:hypothetical protein
VILSALLTQFVRGAISNLQVEAIVPPRPAPVDGEELAQLAWRWVSNFEQREPRRIP